MRPEPSKLDRATVLILRAGVAIPILYFGIQALVAPFYPDFSFRMVVASMLGSDRSPGAAFFNAGVAVTGLLTIVVGLAVWRALRRLGVRVWLAAILSAAFLVNGAQDLWAARYPLPDPRHGGHPLFVVVMIAMPFLIAVTLWRFGNWALRSFFTLCMLIIAVMALVMSRKTSLDPHAFEGLAQRVLAFPIFVPMGVAAYVLARRFQALASASASETPSS